MLGIVIAATLLAACSLHHDEDLIGHVTARYTFVTLTPKRPTAHIGKSKIKLLSIGDDGAAQISIVPGDKVLTALPGGYFESEEFAEEGLRLLSASRSNGVASLVWTDCGPR